MEWFVQPSTATVATAPPLSAAEVKAQLNVPSTDTDDDTLINGYVQAARRLLERRVPGGLSISRQGWKYVSDRFPAGNDALRLPQPPLQSITTVTYFDEANSSTTLDTSTDIRLFNPSEMQGWLEPAIGANWPSTKDRTDAVTVEFIAGPGSTSSTDVRQELRHATALLCAHWYENRESVIVGAISKPLEFTVDALLAAAGWGYYG